MANTHYDEAIHALSCAHCLYEIEVPGKVYRDAHALMEMVEEWELCHSECHKFKDARRARQSWEFMKEKHRIGLHQRRRAALTANH